MKKRCINICEKIFLILVMVISFSGCMERIDIELSPGEYLTFRAVLDENDDLKTKSFASHFSIVEEEWPLILDQYHIGGTKATLQYALNDYSGGAGVFGYTYSSSDNTPDYQPWSQFNKQKLKYTFDGDEMTSKTPPRWSTLPTGQGDKLRIFSYAPYDSEETDNIISITDIVKSQTDIIAAVSEPIDVSTSSPRESIKLGFEHIFTAIKIDLGDFSEITKFSITGIKTAGDFTIGSGWTVGQDEGTYTISEDVSEKLSSPILMIPQKLDEDAILSITTSEGTYSVSLTGREWKQGKLITYTLNKEADGSEYIYFDLAAGDITINGSSCSYSGKIFKTTTTQNDAGEPVLTTEEEVVSGTHTDGNKYYVYQSTEANRTTTGIVGESLVLPSYDPVTYKGELWTDFIATQTGENGVTTVIEAWDRLSDSEDGPAKSTDHYLGLSAEKLNDTKYNDGVRGAGRTATDNRIDIEGNVGNTTLVIDNIYSVYQEVGESTTERFDRYRTEGGISFRPLASGSKLTVNIVGDNRLGCVHYSNNNENELIFKGAGSLTVANTDFWKQTANGITGYYRNRSCSVIGSADYLGNSSTDDHAYNITIESGIIYAGATKAEFCTAIGGGGNGNSTITIKGGTVIAVASGTGTAIGGGSGMSQAGGEGTVTIEGGNVYAYNHANVISIPSSAIGGAGSKNDIGSLGTVTIAGGNVYAYSGLGTAIGGGSSFSQSGGDAVVTITGGNVIARSGSEVSAGIGGGTTRAGGENCGINWNSNKSKNVNGGNATITIGIDDDINANTPILRTGSIGGGGSKKSGGNIGNATINIYDGDIQAQFVMADSDNNKFNMTGGLIRNSDTSDDEYTCIQENGGAVYMEKGTCTISGNAKIKKCSSDAKGGAIYIKGGTFTMEGGVIEQCSSNSDGGAIYIEGGNVTLKGGEISNNVALNGNGGAVCIQGGNFKMINYNDKDAKIVNNAAFDKNHSGTGNGGGIYVTSSNELAVNIISGTISGNSSGRYGGGVCVDMTDKDDITTTVNVGEKESAPTINSNSATHKGGGIYVDGKNAFVNLNNGTVSQNQTTAYQINPDVAVENGLVTLAKEGITTQVTITFNNNNLYYNSGEDQKETQFIVSYTNNTLRSDVFDQLDSYYNTFVEWNTRRDGKGESYSNGQVVKLKENIELFARWKNQ